MNNLKNIITICVAYFTVEFKTKFTLIQSKIMPVEFTFVTAFTPPCFLICLHALLYSQNISSKAKKFKRKAFELAVLRHEMFHLQLSGSKN